MNFKRLKQARVEAGISQWQLAERSGVSRDTIYRLEAGKADNVCVTTLMWIAGALGVSVAEILPEEARE